jgi:putative tryptophan/tyrosine transport system substrate-binding protein
MRRREFIAVIAGAAAWPFAGHAQQTERVRRIGVLMLYAEDDPAGQVRARAFRQQLERLNWTIGHNVRIDYHWGTGDADWVRSAVTQIVRLSPEVILANGGQAVLPMQQATRTIPIIFIGSTDPVAEGFVQSLARPGGTATGFTVLEPSQGPKLLGLLKEIAPLVRRVTVLIHPANSGNRLLAEMARSAAPTLGVDVMVAPVRESVEIEAAIVRLSGEPNCGLIVSPDPATNAHRKLIVELAARYQLPAIHALRAATVEGGLMSYGVNIPELFRQAAFYADRILRGEKAGDLPVQQPTKFEFVINLTTAKKLGLEVPSTLLATADEVIE